MQFVIAIVAAVIGLAFTFGGWRFFLLLLPFWGFPVGFNVGTDATTHERLPRSGRRARQA